MKIAVNGDLFTLKKGMHELNLTLGGVPFKADGLVNQVLLYRWCAVCLRGPVCKCCLDFGKLSILSIKCSKKS